MIKPFNIIVASFLSISAFSQQTSEVEIGYSYYESEDYNEAIDHFTKAIEADPENAEIFYLRGVCKSQSGDNEAAIRDYTKALALDENYAEVYYEKGYSLFLLNRYEESIISFDRAIALKPDYAEALFNRGSVKCIQGDKAGAVEDWKRAESFGAYIPELECN